MRDRISRAMYYFLLAFTKAVVFSLARWEVVNADLLPAEGGIVLVSNHKHLLDPPLIAASMKRRLHPMAKRELFETPLIGWILWAYGAFPVRRYSAAIGALRAARNHPRRRKLVLRLPEAPRPRPGGGLARGGHEAGPLAPRRLHQLDIGIARIAEQGVDTGGGKIPGDDRGGVHVLPVPLDASRAMLIHCPGFVQKRQPAMDGRRAGGHGSEMKGGWSWTQPPRS